MILAFINSEKTPWFFLGMATEGFGIGFQVQSGFGVYPILDFIIGAAIGFFLLYWQKKEAKKKDDVESSGPVAD
jgi:hypothetical protein